MLLAAPVVEGFPRFTATACRAIGGTPVVAEGQAACEIAGGFYALEQESLPSVTVTALPAWWTVALAGLAYWTLTRRH
jgi:hypothetical protein